MYVYIHIYIRIYYSDIYIIHIMLMLCIALVLLSDFSVGNGESMDQHRPTQTKCTTNMSADSQYSASSGGSYPGMGGVWGGPVRSNGRVVVRS